MQLLMLAFAWFTISKELQGKWKLKLIMKLQHFIISVSKLTQNFLEEAMTLIRISVVHLQN